MNICRSDKHEDIVFTGIYCPLCEAIKVIEELRKEFEIFQKTMDWQPGNSVK